MAFIKVFLILLLLVFFSACSNPGIVERHNKKSGVTTITTTDNRFINSFFGESVSLNPEKLIKPDQSVEYRLHVIVKFYSSFLNIDKNDSLVLTVDGIDKTFSSKEGSESSQKRTPFGDRIEEAIYENIAPEELEAIAQAKAIKAKIIGTYGILESLFTQKNFDTFRRFVEEQVKKK